MIQNTGSTSVANDLQTAMEPDVAVPQIPESVSSASNLQEAVTLRTRPSTSSLASAATTNTKQLTEEQQDNLKEMLSSAMEETHVYPPSVSAPRRPKPTNPFDEMEQFGKKKSDASLSDDEFVHLDESLGSGITNARGEPKVRILEEDGFVIVPNHLRLPSEEKTTEMMHFPDDHPRPISTISIEDFSLCVYLFGGSDFCEFCRKKGGLGMFVFRGVACN